MACAIASVFVARSLADDSSQLVFSSHFPFGGALFQFIAPGPGGTIYVAGGTAFGDPKVTPFPTTPDALQPDPPPAPANCTSWGVPFFAVIDPSQPGKAQLVYSTYFGSSGLATGCGLFFDSFNGLAVDKAGRAYVCGTTFSTDFPVTRGALQAANLFATNPVVKRQEIPPETAFFAVIDPSQTGSSQLVYSTYLGAEKGPSYCAAVSVDDNGLAYLTGWTGASDFPLSRNAFRRRSRLLTGDVTSTPIAFAAVIDPARSGSSSLVYSTLLGGNNNTHNGQGDSGYAIAPGPGGLIYVGGGASTSDFPLSASAFQRHIVLTPLSGESQNEFLTVLNPARTPGRQLVYSTYLGGKSFTGVSSLAVDASGIAYLFGTGITDVTTGVKDAFPTTPGAFQDAPIPGGRGFQTIAKINPFRSGKASLLYSTDFGDGDDCAGCSYFPAEGMALGPAGLVYLAGILVGSPEFPITADAFEPTLAGGGGFVTILDPLAKGSASVVYSTYLNRASVEPGSREFVDAAGRAYLSGGADSHFPTTNSYDTSSGTWLGILAPPIPSNIPTPPAPPTPTPTRTPRP